MITTVEDTVEVLAGKRSYGPSVHVSASHSDIKIIRSITNQIANGFGLTDRQLDLVLKKIKKYQSELELKGIDVDAILESRLTRLPIREIDRSQTITLTSGNPKKISIKYTGNSDFYSSWQLLKLDIVGKINEKPQIKEFAFNEINVLHTVTYFKDQNFEFDPALLDFYQSLEEIQKNSDSYLPYIDLDNEKIVLTNINKQCRDYIDHKFGHLEATNFLAYIDRLKSCGIYRKSPKIIEKIQEFLAMEKSKKIASLPASRFRIPPSDNDFSEVVSIIQELDQWPVLVMVDDNEKAILQVSKAIDPLLHAVDREHISIFFRLDNGEQRYREFNQFVKDNRLNNFIGPDTKVVFISKNRIPKPLLRAEWMPQSAVVMSNYDYGRSSAYIDNFSTVYYYNSAVAVRHNRIKGSRSIVEL
jgi:hypothetical protein